MASKAAKQVGGARATGDGSMDAQRGAAKLRSRAKVVPAGALPISEVAFDRPGAPSPFGDDIAFPVPVEPIRFISRPSIAPADLAS